MLDFSRRNSLVSLLLIPMFLSSFVGSSVQAKSTNQTLAGHKGTTSKSYRLSESIVPQKYSLDFTPNPEAGTFTGSAIIDVILKKPAKTIVLNANELTVTSAYLVSDKADSARIPVQINADKSMEQVSLSTSKTQPAGKYSVHCTFKGSLSDKLIGFYRSTYKDKEGKTHYISTTQMEPTDARRMFPCFDEPSFKAAFKIKVRTDAKNTAISNAPLEKEWIDEASKKKIIEFETSPLMSTYLLALCVGEFKSTEPVESEGVQIRVWSVNHDPALGNYGRDNAAKLLKYLNSYFGKPYPWKKLDLLAIPDFQAGAMENPGAITFREQRLLASEKDSSLSMRQEIVGIIAHEMAHLWFGDLVTMKWWDDIWLNEAFATWMADKAVDKIKPEWQALDQFYADRHRAFFTDALHATRTIQSPVIKPEDAQQMFDEITYVKGAAVLRMLEFYLGEKVFQAGVSAYINEFAFSNAATNDLWDALGKASGKPVKAIMDTWCKQPGYPLVSVKSEAGKLNVSQERFFLDGRSDKAQTWKLPLGLRSLRSDSSQTKFELVSAKAASLVESKAPGFANGGGTGFYRCMYDAELNDELKDSLKNMAPAERLCFLGDHQALAFAGRIPVGQYLDLLKAYKSETNFAVWDYILDGLKKLDRFVEPASRPAFAKFVRYVLTDEYKRLGWQSQSGEPEPHGLLRGNVIAVLGTLGEDPEVIAKARDIFAEYEKNPSAPNQDVLDAVCRIVAYNGNQRDFDHMRLLWKKADSPEREHRNLYALAYFRQPELIKSALNLSIGKELRKQDAPKFLYELFDDNTAKVAAWGFMRTHWPQIKQAYAPHMLAKLAEAPASLTSETAYKQLSSFFAINKIPEAAAGTSRMLEKVRINVQFQKTSAKSLNAWLKQTAPTLK